MKSSFSLKACLEIARFHLRFRPVPRCDFAISPKASSGSSPVPPGSAYPKLCYRDCRVLPSNSLHLKLSRASHYWDANIANHFDVPHIHCYGIIRAARRAPRARCARRAPRVARSAQRPPRVARARDRLFHQ